MGVGETAAIDSVLLDAPAAGAKALDAAVIATVPPPRATVPVKPIVTWFPLLYVTEAAVSDVVPTLIVKSPNATPVLNTGSELVVTTIEGEVCPVVSVETEEMVAWPTAKLRVLLANAEAGSDAEVPAWTVTVPAAAFPVKPIVI